MMKKIFHTFCGLLLPALLLTGVAGCSKERTKPPMERNDLVIRFFENIGSGNNEAAAVEARKLRAMDVSNDYVDLLISIQESNAFISQAQKCLNSGDVDGAIAALTEGTKKYHTNSALRQMLGRARQLRNAPRLFAAMEKADTSSAMEAALTAAMTGLSDNNSPKLEQYFRSYEARIAQAKVAEAKLAADRDKKEATLRAHTEAEIKAAKVAEAKVEAAVEAKVKAAEAKVKADEEAKAKAAEAKAKAAEAKKKLRK